MKAQNAKRMLPLMLCLLIAAALTAYSFGLFEPRAEYMPYPQFAEALEAGRIESAAIQKDAVRFRLTGDGTEYRTDQPNYDRFKETLLLSGARVTDELAGSDDLTAVLDGAFDILFFGLILFGAYKLIDYSRSTFRVVRRTGVTFDDIAGMDSLKREMMQTVDILKNREAYAKRGIRPTKGIVLEGPPGNGKTLFARALAQEAGVNFIAAKGADFQSALMSMGARKIRMLFGKAAKRKPCIVFIDEFDSIGERRNYAGTGVDKENNRIITAMLNEMDGFDGSDGILVIAATNSYQSLDPALIRPGRFDLKYTVGNPDAETRRQLIALYTQKKHLAADVRPDALVQAFNGLSCAAIETVLNEATTAATLAGREEITAPDIALAVKRTKTAG